jgi:hypothetical protein
LPIKGYFIYRENMQCAMYLDVNNAFHHGRTEQMLMNPAAIPMPIQGIRRSEFSGPRLSHSNQLIGVSPDPFWRDTQRQLALGLSHSD